jgi:hypothetical protein
MDCMGKCGGTSNKKLDFLSITFRHDSSLVKAFL